MNLLVLAACSIISLSVYAHARPGAPGPATVPATQPVAINKLCPVTKDPVDPKIPTVEYKVKTIGFCCDDCIKEFKADPEKYMKDLK
jgi:YHS domain-containing protein